VRDVSAQAPLRIGIDVANSSLADRLAAALSHVEDLELVGRDREADVMVVATEVAAREVQVEVQLTARELEVLALLAEGDSNKLIARRLGISIHTAKYHVASLFEKLDAVSRTDVVASAARIGVLHL
jgi:DNA-binding CsgD family transcriptional regulator